MPRSEMDGKANLISRAIFSVSSDSTGQFTNVHYTMSMLQRIQVSWAQ